MIGGIGAPDLFVDVEGVLVGDFEDAELAAHAALVVGAAVGVLARSCARGVGSRAMAICPSQSRLRRSSLMRRSRSRRAGEALGDVARVGGDARGDDAFAHLLLVGKRKVLGGRHVAEEVRARGRGDRAAYGRRDVVVARGDVGDDAARGRRKASRR